MQRFIAMAGVQAKVSYFPRSCLLTTTLMMLDIVSMGEMISFTVLERETSVLGLTKCSLSVCVRRLKTLFP